MSSVHAPEDFSVWLQTTQGQYVLDWEHAHFDALVADIFGYNAVQIGLPTHPFLRASRISYRFELDAVGPATLRSEAFALPLASGSVDLVLLPHVLEFSRHPHEVLREVERVLVPEGSVLISGLNPFSLFGLRRALSRSGGRQPWRGHYYSAARIRDWLTLL
ncbi:class I SAM-dependent methyltransferase, partial [Azoarcus taiwanensis]